MPGRDKVMYSGSVDQPADIRFQLKNVCVHRQNYNNKNVPSRTGDFHALINLIRSYTKVTIREAYFTACT